MSESRIIPNSYQTPNFFIDECMGYLTPQEWMCLSYALRRVYGFGKQTDTISLKQFSEGIRGRYGKILDRGTGLSRATCSKALASLQQFGLIVMVAENDPKMNHGPEWALPISEDEIDLKGLVARKKGQKQANKSRTAAANGARFANNAPPPAPDIEASDLPHTSDIGGYVAHTTPPNVARTTPPNVGRTHKNQYQNPESKPSVSRAMLRELAQAFTDCTGIPEPAKGTKSAGVRWWQPLRRMLELELEGCLGDEELASNSGAYRLELVVKHMRRDKLTISAPQSLLKTYEAAYGAAITKGASRAQGGRS